MTIDEAKEVLNQISYQDYWCELIPRESLCKLSIMRQDFDSITKSFGKREYSCFLELNLMNENELIHRVFGLLLGLAQHEVCEFFRYKNIQVFSPHRRIV